MPSGVPTRPIKCMVCDTVKKAPNSVCPNVACSKHRTTTYKTIKKATAKEGKAFADASKCYGRDWAQVARSVGAKTLEQTRSHAQQHFKRLSQ
eukprot:COSAG02_NODE_35456_length_468_cov_0.691057_1_plen_92_part_10